MSPSKTRPQFIPARPRSELFTAIGVGAGIVLGTALLIWLIRPGTAGIPGGGGLFNRQARMTILVLLTAAVLAVVVSFIVRRRRPLRMGRPTTLAIGSVVVIALGVVGGIFWPGGVIRHWPKQPKLSNAPVPPVSSVPDTAPVTAPPTTKPGTKPTTASTAPGSATTVAPASTSVPGATTAPAATTVPAATTPTTAATPTTPAG